MRYKTYHFTVPATFSSLMLREVNWRDAIRWDGANPEAKAKVERKVKAVIFMVINNNRSSCFVDEREK